MKKALVIILLSSCYLMNYSQNTPAVIPVCDGTEGEIAFVIDSDIFNDLSKPFTVKYAPTGTYDLIINGWIYDIRKASNPR